MPSPFLPIVILHLHLFRLSRWGSSVRARSGSPFAAIAQLVERILGKDEVSSSNLDSSSIERKPLESLRFRWFFCLHRQLQIENSPPPHIAEDDGPPDHMDSALVIYRNFQK